MIGKLDSSAGLESPPVQERRDTSRQLIPSNPSLMFCWHLHVGFYRDVEFERLHAYSTFFYAVFLNPHLQKQALLLGQAEGIAPLIARQAQHNHRRLHRLFAFEKDVRRSLGLIEEKLEAHARFERGVLADQAQLVPGGTEMGRAERCRHVFDLDLAQGLRSWGDKYWELR